MRPIPVSLHVKSCGPDNQSIHKDWVQSHQYKSIWGYPIWERWMERSLFLGVTINWLIVMNWYLTRILNGSSCLKMVRSTIR